MGGFERLAMMDFDRAIETIEPHRLTSPLIFSSPHSGSIYPERFLAASRLDPLTLRRSEDAFVDELFLPCVALGAPLLRALFPRAYLDVNREPYEFDPQVFEGRLPDFVNTRSLRVAVGLGTIPRVVGDSQTIYKQPISLAEGLGRIEWLYRPYHAQLKALIERALGLFGRAVLIDCHSMPSNAADVAGLDVVLGDRYGASAEPDVVESLETSLRASGYRVRRNKPFAGGFITESLRRARRKASTPSRSRLRGRSISTNAGSCGRRRGPRCATISSTRPGIWRANSAATHTVWRRSDGKGRAADRGAGTDVALQQPGPSGRKDRGRRRRLRRASPDQKRRPPCCHGGLQSREETPKEGICGTACRTATISALSLPLARAFSVR